MTMRHMRIDNASASVKRLLTYPCSSAVVNVEVKCGNYADAQARFDDDDDYVRLFSKAMPHVRSSGGGGGGGGGGGHSNCSNQELLERLSRMEDKLTRMVPTTHVTNFNFIIINDFGKEDTSYMPDVDRWLKLRSKGVVLAIKEIHFNDNHMENRNVRLKSSKKATVEVVENGAWTVRCLLSVQDTMIRNAFKRIAARYVKDDAYRDEVQEADGEGLVDWVMQMMCAGHENQKVMVPILVLMSYVSKSPENTYIIDDEFIATFLMEYFVTTVAISTLGLVFARIMRKKRYFEYPTQGITVSRAYRDVMVGTCAVMFGIPFFMVF